MIHRSGIHLFLKKNHSIKSLLIIAAPISSSNIMREGRYWPRLKSSTAERVLFYMPTYNKLVRDRIPHIIMSKGKECSVRILESEEYKQALRMKLLEEAEEYFETAKDQDALEELADMMEVIRALAEVHGADAAELDKLGQTKPRHEVDFRSGCF
jgi:predicted house-cleaning noncanonical NTP pyrophosphatase (MazG superfamily)